MKVSCISKRKIYKLVAKFSQISPARLCDQFNPYRDSNSAALIVCNVEIV